MRIAVIGLGVAASKTDRWVGLFRDCGANAHRIFPPFDPAEDVDLVVVLVDPADDVISVRDLAQQIEDSFTGRLAPVVDGSSPAQVLPDLSQIVIGNRPWAEVAAQILESAHLTGSQWVELGRLSSLAGQWRAGGRSRAALLSDSELTAAGDLLASPNIATRAGYPAVVELVTASRHQSRRKRRQWLSAFAVVTLLLGMATATAGWQAAQARSAASAAAEEGSRSTANRLSRDAVDALGGDPDLPWLLADRALRSAHTPESMAAATTVLQSVPAHTTINLGKAPRSLSADREGTRLVIGYSDGSFELRNADGTHPTTVLAPEDGDGTGVLSPDGATLFVTGPQPRMIALSSMAATQVPAMADAPAVWLADRVLTVAPGGLVAVAPDGSSAPTTIQPGRDPGDIVTLGVSPSGTYIGLVGTGRYAIVDAATGQEVAGGDRTALDEIGRYPSSSIVFALAEYEADRRRGAEWTLPSASELTLNSQAVQPLQSGAQVAGVLSEVRVRDVSGATLMSFPAHRGPVLGVAETDRGFASVGGDRQLRLWRPHLPVYPFEFDQMRILVDDGRARVALDQTGRTVVVSQGPLVRALDATTLAPLAETRFTAFGASVASPSQQSGVVGIVSDRFAQTLNVQTFQRGWVVQDPTTSMASVRTTALTATAPDASAIISAQDKTVQIYSPRLDYVPTFETGSPVVSVFFASGAPTWVTARGQLYQERDGQARVIDVIRQPNGPDLVAATMVHDTTLTVDSSGALRTYPADRTLTTLGQLADARALVPNTDGTRVAVIGPQETTILDTSTGAVRGRIPSSTGGPVEDVAFNGEHDVLVVRDEGLVELINVDPTSQGTTLRENAPRPLSDLEADAFAVEP